MKKVRGLAVAAIAGTAALAAMIVRRIGHRSAATKGRADQEPKAALKAAPQEPVAPASADVETPAAPTLPLPSVPPLLAPELLLLASPCSSDTNADAEGGHRLRGPGVNTTALMNGDEKLAHACRILTPPMPGGAPLPRPAARTSTRVTNSSGAARAGSGRPAAATSPVYRALTSTSSGYGRLSTEGLCAGLPEDLRHKIITGLEREPPPASMTCMPGCSPNEVRARHLATYGLDTYHVMCEEACDDPRIRVSVVLVALPYRASVPAVLLQCQPAAATGQQPRQIPVVRPPTPAVWLWDSRAPAYEGGPHTFLMSYKKGLSVTDYLDCIIMSEN
eukprot:XP_001700550.1 predicted protein [Chlamydomonas reinhardtii]